MKQIVHICTVIIYTILVSATQANAKDLHVAMTGDDSVTYTTNDINHPWKSIEKAFGTTLQAGDNVWIHGGTYNMTARTGKQIGGHGTATDPIKFSNYESEVVTIHGSPVESKYMGQIHIDRNYVHINGMTFHTHGTTIQIGQTSLGTATHCKVTNCTFYNDTFGGGRNYGSVSFYNGNAADGVVKDCIFHGPGAEGNGNTAGVYASKPSGIKVLNSSFYDIPKGIFYKHASVGHQTGIEFAYNYFTRCNKGIHTNSQYTNIHDNIFHIGDYLSGTDGGTGADGDNIGGDYNTIHHNTFINDRLELVHYGDGGGPTHNTITNNIFMNLGQIYPWKDTLHNALTDYNLYPNGDIFSNNRMGYNLSEWQSHNNSDGHSLSTTPIFVKINPSSIDDYALTATSTGHQAASDGTDMGANVSLVGPNIEVASDTFPPILTQVTPVPTQTTNTTPKYTFNSNEAGTITYTGDCSSPTTAAVHGENTITFNSLADGTHSNCTITVTDSSSNRSNHLSIPSFTINTTAVVIRSDVNQQNGTNKADALLTLRNSLGLDMSLTSWKASATTGDVNCDGISNSIDALLILRSVQELDMSETGWCVKFLEVPLI